MKRDLKATTSLTDTIPALNNIKSQDLLTGLLNLQHVSNEIGRAMHGLEDTILVKVNKRIQEAYEVTSASKMRDQYGVEKTKKQLGGMRILQSMAQRSGDATIVTLAPEPMPSSLPIPDPKDLPPMDRLLD